MPARVGTALAPAGYHLLLEGDQVSRRRGDIGRFLRGAVRVTGLTAISPYVVRENGGIVIIAESHVSVHIEGERAFADVFSCRPFRWARVTALARHIWGGDWQSEYFERSKHSQRGFVGPIR